MFSYIQCGIKATIEAKFDELWWSICKGLMNIIDLLDKAFRFVVGAAELRDNSAEVIDSSGLLTQTFNNLFGAEGSMSSTYMYMVFFCILMMLIFVFIGIIRAQFQKDSCESLKKMAAKGFWSIIKMLMVPLFFFLALSLVGYIFAVLIALMSGGGDELKLADVVCRCFDSSGGNIDYRDSYSDIQDLLAQDKFDFVLCILTSCCLLVTLCTATLAVTKRFVKIFFYYVTAPMVLSKSMIDEGKSWELWKDNLLAQLLGAGGVIITMYIFLQVVPEIASIIDNSIEDKALAAILKIVFILGMSTVPAGSTALMAQLVSQGSGQNESNDLMHTQQMLGNGLRLAGAATGKVLAGGLAALGGAGGLAGASRMLGGAGGALGAGAGGASVGGGGLASAAGGTGAAAKSGSAGIMGAIRNGLSKTQAGRDQLANGQRHQGGASLALMRGGAIGMLGYGAGRLASRVGTLVGTANRAILGKIGSSYRNSARGQARQIAKDAKANAEPSSRKANAAAKTALNQAKAQKMVEEKNKNRAAKENPVQSLMNKGSKNNTGTNTALNKFYNKEIDALNKQAQSVNKTLSSDRYENVGEKEKKDYRSNMLDGKIKKLEGQLRQGGASKEMMARFKQAQTGSLKKEKEGDKK